MSERRQLILSIVRHKAQTSELALLSDEEVYELHKRRGTFYLRWAAQFLENLALCADAPD